MIVIKLLKITIYVMWDKNNIQSNLHLLSPVLKGHFHNFIWIEPLLSGHLSYKATFSLSQRGPLNTGLTIYFNLA